MKYTITAEVTLTASEVGHPFGMTIEADTPEDAIKKALLRIPLRLTPKAVMTTGDIMPTVKMSLVT